jgi:hypothetical protein
VQSCATATAPCFATRRREASSWRHRLVGATLETCGQCVAPLRKAQLQVGGLQTLGPVPAGWPTSRAQTARWPTAVTGAVASEDGAVPSLASASPGSGSPMRARRTHAPSAARAAGGAHGPSCLQDPRADSHWRLPVGARGPGLRVREAHSCRTRPRQIFRGCQDQRAASHCDFHAPGLHDRCHDRW